MSRHPNIVNLEDLAADERSAGRFSFKNKRLGTAAGGQKLGCGWYEVQPGHAAFPFHAHFANEEAVFVLSGRGVMRKGDQSFEVGPGDYIAHLTGPGPANAHQLTATGTEPLRYLCISTMTSPEVCVYPDANKVGAIANGPNGRQDGLFRFFREGDAVGYFDGEDLD